MKGAYEIGGEDRDRIARGLALELAREPEVVFAYLYGSCAESRQFRDVDAGVFLRSAGKGPQAVFDLAQRLSSSLGLPVDVRILNDAPVSFLFHVLRGGQLLSRDDELLSALIENTVRRYLDAAPLRRRSTREAFAE